MVRLVKDFTCPGSSFKRTWASCQHRLPLHQTSTYFVVPVWHLDCKRYINTSFPLLCFEDTPCFLLYQLINSLQSASLQLSSFRINWWLELIQLSSSHNSSTFDSATWVPWLIVFSVLRAPTFLVGIPAFFIAYIAAICCSLSSLAHCLANSSALGAS